MPLFDLVKDPIFAFRGNSSFDFWIFLKYSYWFSHGFWQLMIIIFIFIGFSFAIDFEHEHIEKISKLNKLRRTSFVACAIFCCVVLQSRKLRTCKAVREFLLKSQQVLPLCPSGFLHFFSPNASSVNFKFVIQVLNKFHITQIKVKPLLSI